MIRGSRIQKYKRVNSGGKSYRFYYTAAVLEFKRKEVGYKQFAQVFREDGRLGWSMNNQIARREWGK